MSANNRVAASEVASGIEPFSTGGWGAGAGLNMRLEEVVNSE